MPGRPRLARAATAATTAATVTFGWLTPLAAHADPANPSGGPSISATRGPLGLPVPPTASAANTGPRLGDLLHGDPLPPRGAGTQAGIVVPPVKAGVALGPAGGSEPPAAGVPLAAVPQHTTTNAAAAMDPVAVLFMTESSITERLGEQLKQLDVDLAAARAAAITARRPWDVATAQLAVQRQRARDIAADAYKSALALGPLQGYANDLQDLGAVAPMFGQKVDAARKPPGRDSVQFDVQRAEHLERTTHAAYDAAVATQQDLNARRAVVKEQFDRHSKALAVLRARTKDNLPTLTKQRDTYEQGLSGSYTIGTSVNGYQANPQALAAVQFALRQVGKPYVWAAEGPNAYDCSGLTYAAYGSVGRTIPRVSVAQYAGLTKLRSVAELLPGDLLFFSTDRNNWREIHHVAMYVGNGKMVHAPTFGDHVRVAPIWWSEFYGAARVLPAVRVPGSRPTTPPATTAPATTAPRPTTAGPRTTAPPSTTRPATPTTPPVTTAPPTTKAPPSTTAPSTTAPSTTAPSTTAAETSAAETTAAKTNEPATESSASTAASSAAASPNG